MILLMMLGLLTLFSATYYKAQDGGDPLSEVKKQVFGAAVGAAAMAVTAHIPYQFWGRRKVVMTGVGLSFLLLLLVAIPGIGTSINGSRRWLTLGPLSFQPGELAKYATVLFMAMTLTVRGKKIQKLWTGILPVLIVPGIMFLLILEQPNLSTAGTIIIVSLLMVLLSGAKWRHMALLGLGGLALATSVSAVISVVLLYISLQKSVRGIAVSKVMLRSVLLFALSGACGWGSLLIFRLLGSLTPFRLLSFGAAMLVFLCLYALAAFAAGIVSVSEIRAVVKKRSAKGE
jgi:cell division protein FtsW (lipid II flippase)